MTPSDQTELRQLKAIFEPLEASGFPTESVMKAISSAIAAAEQRAEHQGALNALVQLKQDRIAHTLGTPVGEWKREIDFIDEHILALAELEQSLRKEQE